VRDFSRLLRQLDGGLVAVAFGLLTLLLVCSFFIEVPGDHLTMNLPVAVELKAPIHSVSSGTDAQIEKLRGNLKFPVRKGAFFSGSVFLVVLIFGFLLWMVTQVRHVFRSLSEGLPFVAENGRRIRWVGFAVIFGEVARAALVYYWSYYTSLHFTANGLRFVASADINGITIVSGLAILVIAEVFQEGARLREDQSLTI
jgi:hypothetical protein